MAALHLLFSFVGPYSFSGLVLPLWLLPVLQLFVLLYLEAIRGREEVAGHLLHSGLLRIIPSRLAGGGSSLLLPY